MKKLFVLCATVFALTACGNANKNAENVENATVETVETVQKATKTVEVAATETVDQIQAKIDELKALGDKITAEQKAQLAKLEEAIKAAKQMLENHGSGDSDYAHALSRLADAMARMKVVEIARNRSH